MYFAKFAMVVEQFAVYWRTEQFDFVSPRLWVKSVVKTVKWSNGLATNASSGMVTFQSLTASPHQSSWSNLFQNLVHHTNSRLETWQFLNSMISVGQRNACLRMFYLCLWKVSFMCKIPGLGSVTSCCHCFLQRQYVDFLCGSIVLVCATYFAFVVFITPCWLRRVGFYRNSWRRCGLQTLVKRIFLQIQIL